MTQHRFASLVGRRRVAAPTALFAVYLTAVPFVPAAEPAAIDSLRMNQVQVIGTHNSYHVRKNEPGKRGVAEWNYSHAPLDVQLDRGLRSFELDLHDRAGEFQVFHVPLLDEGTTCRKLADGLATVRRWSDAHPRHVPISFLFELKKEGPGLDKRIKEPDAAALDRLDALLDAAFPRERRISPDDVRGARRRWPRACARPAGRRWRPAAARCCSSCTTMASAATCICKAIPRWLAA